jgi:nucleoside 2-deoxyribosyltransferase
MKVVVCGSYGDLEGFLETLRFYQETYGVMNVFPNTSHMEKSLPCIFAHHVMDKDTDATIGARASLMESYFENIDRADFVIINNQKNGVEYYGTGTTMELGYAFAKGKSIVFTRQPTNSNILSLIKLAELNSKREVCTT